MRPETERRMVIRQTVPKKASVTSRGRNVNNNKSKKLYFNYTSAQLAYTVLFMLVVLENTGSRQIKNTGGAQINYNSEKANNTKQNYPGSVAFYDTRPGNNNNNNNNNNNADNF